MNDFKVLVMVAIISVFVLAGLGRCSNAATVNADERDDSVCDDVLGAWDPKYRDFEDRYYIYASCTQRASADNNGGRLSYVYEMKIVNDAPYERVIAFNNGNIAVAHMSPFTLVSKVLEHRVPACSVYTITFQSESSPRAVYSGLVVGYDDGTGWTIEGGATSFYTPREIGTDNFFSGSTMIEPIPVGERKSHGCLNELLQGTLAQ